MKTSQKLWIKTQLEEKGMVSRNQCLRRYISRAAARLQELREEGMNIVGKKVKEDYVYYLEDSVIQ
jgi:23S rRNA U2552 (ribose-2'-O)-methylase RlmE/FtsJ